MTYVLGRWYRFLATPEYLGLDLEPAKVPWFVGDCLVRKGLLVAPILKDWFVYTPTQSRDKKAEFINWTCSDIRWFVSAMTTPIDEDLRNIHIRRDSFLCWTNNPEHADRGLVLSISDPQDEWVIYVAWVNHVLTSNATAQKGGRIRLGYKQWFQHEFEGHRDPLRLAVEV
jgi:hypothetical protein